MLDRRTAACACLVLALGAITGCSGGVDDRWPVWSYVSPVIIQPKCATASCHSRGTAEAGLDLSSVDRGYVSLMQLDLPVRGMDKVYPRTLVTPYNPDQSRLVWMLRGKGAQNMPPDRPLADADIRLVENWISMGAQDD